MKEKYVIYSRKSRFTGKGESVENQVEMCRRYIAGQFGEEAAAQALIYEDEGFSGGTLERPEFKRMMEASHEIRFRAIVVYRLDRISRSISDFAGLIEELGKRNIGFISIKEQFDTSSPMGRAMMYIASVFSQLERETIAERIRDNMLELAKTGRWLGGNTPIGYSSENVSSVTVDGKTRSACRLVRIPGEIQLVRRIYESYIAMGSVSAVDRLLLEGGCKTRRGRDFSRFSIRAILTNPVYMKADREAYEYLRLSGVELFADEKAFDGSKGIMAYNRTRQKNGRNELLPMDCWIVALGAHQGCIDGRTWVQVQKLLELNGSKSYRRPRINEALLSGILRCGLCGGFMRPKLSERYNEKGERIYTYRCETRDRTRGRLCSAANINGNLLDEGIMEEIMKLRCDPAVLAGELERGSQLLRDKRDSAVREAAGLRQRLCANGEDIAALVKSLPRYMDTELERDVTGQIERLHELNKKIQARIEELEAGEGEGLPGEEAGSLAEKMRAEAYSLPQLWDTEARRSAVRLTVSSAVWDGESVSVYFMESGAGADREAEGKIPRGEDSK